MTFGNGIIGTALSNGNIVNYTVLGTRRVDLTFGVSYDADIKQTKEVLMEVIKSHPSVLEEPAPTVNVSELADSSVNFAVRPWCKSEDYWSVYYDVLEEVKTKFDENNISIPFPQMDIHMNRIEK